MARAFGGGRTCGVAALFKSACKALLVGAGSLHA